MTTSINNFFLSYLEQNFEKLKQSLGLKSFDWRENVSAKKAIMKYVRNKLNDEFYNYLLVVGKSMKPSVDLKTTNFFRWFQNHLQEMKSAKFVIFRIDYIFS